MTIKTNHGFHKFHSAACTFKHIPIGVININMSLCGQQNFYACSQSKNSDINCCCALPVEWQSLHIPSSLHDQHAFTISAMILYLCLLPVPTMSTKTRAQTEWLSDSQSNQSVVENCYCITTGIFFPLTFLISFLVFDWYSKSHTFLKLNFINCN